MEDRRECPLCKSLIFKFAFNRHIKACDGDSSHFQGGDNKKEVKYKTIFTGFCIFCKKECKNHNSQRNHELRCKLNPDRIPSINRKGENNPQYGKPSWNKGLTKETSPIVARMASKLLGKSLGPWSEGDKLKLSKALKESSIVGGIRLGAGRGKKGWYKGIHCDSTWELAYVIWNLDNKININRNTEWFYYMFNDKIHRYYPDFIVEGNLVEIKGYVSDIALAKVQQCPKPVEIISHGKIEKFINYVKEKYQINDISLLYESNLF